MNDPDLELTLLRLLGPSEPELSCDECFEALDRFVEAELADAPTGRVAPRLRAHLAGCPACAEEHESLRALLELEALT